jgi:hypothetical protein
MFRARNFLDIDSDGVQNPCATAPRCAAEKLFELLWPLEFAFQRPFLKSLR